MIPDFHGACPIITFWYSSLKINIAYRVVLYHYGQALVFGIHRRTFGNGPAFQHSPQFQPEIIMQAGGIMPLYYETGKTLLISLALGLGSDFKISFLIISCQCHQDAFLLEVLKLAFSCDIRSRLRE